MITTGIIGLLVDCTLDTMSCANTLFMHIFLTDNMFLIFKVWTVLWSGVQGGHCVNHYFIYKRCCGDTFNPKSVILKYKSYFQLA